ncbi:MAG: protein kinase domain-containing protein, partial [Myxococcota bacterium]
MHAPRIGPYTLDALIGRGGMGVVWRATHRPSGLPVAIKLWTGMGNAAHWYRAALSRELRAIAALDHPHVIVVHDAGHVTADEAARCRSSPGALFVVTELADTDLARDRPSAWSYVRPVLLAILDGLAHAHARGIVHRDLKPENVLRVGATWKLADFGIATVAG